MTRAELSHSHWKAGSAGVLPLALHRMSMTPWPPSNRMSMTPWPPSKHVEVEA
jgi:hypothetical protein